MYKNGTSCTELTSSRCDNSRRLSSKDCRRERDMDINRSRNWSRSRLGDDCENDAPSLVKARITLRRSDGSFFRWINPLDSNRCTIPAMVCWVTNSSWQSDVTVASRTSAKKRSTPICGAVTPNWTQSSRECVSIFCVIDRSVETI